MTKDLSISVTTYEQTVECNGKKQRQIIDMALHLSLALKAVAEILIPSVLVFGVVYILFHM